MNQSEKALLPHRAIVGVNSATYLLAGAAVGGPVGLAFAGLGVGLAYFGNTYLNCEAKTMEDARARGETPKTPDPSILRIR
jgi:hypothetical protein